MCIERIKKIWNKIRDLLNNKKARRRIIFAILTTVVMLVIVHKKSTIDLYSILIVLTFALTIIFAPDYILTFIAIVYALYLPGYIFETKIIYINIQLLNLFLIVYSFFLVFAQLFASNKQMIKRYDGLDRLTFYLVVFIMVLTFYFTVKFYEKQPASPPDGFTPISSETAPSFRLIYSLIAVFTILLDDVLRKIDKMHSEYEENESL